MTRLAPLVVTLLVLTACGSQTLNLHTVRWNNVSVPASVCGAHQRIQLHRGYAVVASTRWPTSSPRVAVYREAHVGYGDLDGDGSDEAALGIVCANLGGTAAGQLGFAQVIFTADRRSLHVLGIVTPKLPAQPGAEHVPLVTVQILPQRVVATEYFYGPNDGDCCASGRARTIWRYVHGSLTPGRPMITKKAAR